VTKPNFSSILCHALEKPESSQKSVKSSLQFLYLFTKVLKLSKVQEVVFGIGLLSSSVAEFRSAGETFVKQKLPELLRAYIDSELGGTTNQEAFGLADVAIEVLHLILTHLLSAPKDSPIVSDDQLQSFLNSLRKDFPRERVPVVLAPLLYNSKHHNEYVALHHEVGNAMNGTMEGNLHDVMEELGYACCATREDCRETLMHFNVANVSPAVVAKVLGMMVKTLSGLEGTGLPEKAGTRSIEQTP
jgi:CCR4-NOT transcription complex subunit 1